jgi:putative aldouronate transport system substrate-binding protein
LALKAVTRAGKIMAIPSLTVPDNSYSLMWIRKDWLDKLGLPVPHTVDEIEKTAQAFITQDPGKNGAGKTIGIVGPQNGQIVHADFLQPENNLFGLDSLFAAYRSYPGFWIKGPDGNAAYGSILPETKTALARLADLYKKGLIDKEMGIRKDSSEPVIGGQAGIYFGMWWSGYFPLPDAIKNNPNANWQAYAVPLDDTGVFNQHMGTPANTFLVVRQGYEHPEAAMKIENLNNRDESLFDLTKGSTNNEVLRLAMGMYDEGKFTYNALTDILAGKATPEQFADPKYDVYKLLKDDAAKIKTVKIAPYDKMDIQDWNVAADPSAWQRLYSIMVGMGAIYDPNAKMNLVYSLTYAPTPTVDSKWTNLKTMEDETILKVILGTAPVDSFDKFVADWKAQGGDQVTAEVQAVAQSQ